MTVILRIWLSCVERVVHAKTGVRYCNRDKCGEKCCNKLPVGCNSNEAKKILHVPKLHFFGRAALSL